MKTLELNQLKHYLGTGLKVMHGDNVKTMIAASGSSGNWIGIQSVIRWQDRECLLRPAMLPLSALTEPVLEGGKVPIVELARINSVDSEIGIIDIRNVGCIYGLNYFDSMGDKYEFIYSSEIKNFTLRYFGTKTQNEPCYQLALFEQLFHWHFWLFDQSLFKTGELIDKSKVPDLKG